MGGASPWLVEFYALSRSRVEGVFIMGVRFFASSVWFLSARGCLVQAAPALSPGLVAFATRLPFASFIRRGGWANSLRYAALKHAQPTSPRLMKLARRTQRAGTACTRQPLAGVVLTLRMILWLCDVVLADAVFLMPAMNWAIGIRRLATANLIG